MESIAWVKSVPARVTFIGIQKAIFEANRAPPPAKKLAWQKVYLMSAQYKRQEEEEDVAQADQKTSKI